MAPSIGYSSYSTRLVWLMLSLRAHPHPTPTPSPLGTLMPGTTSPLTVGMPMPLPLHLVFFHQRAPVKNVAGGIHGAGGVPLDVCPPVVQQDDAHDQLRRRDALCRTCGRRGRELGQEARSENRRGINSTQPAVIQCSSTDSRGTTRTLIDIATYGTAAGAGGGLVCYRVCQGCHR